MREVELGLMTTEEYCARFVKDVPKPTAPKRCKLAAIEAIENEFDEDGSGSEEDDDDNEQA